MIFIGFGFLALPKPINNSNSNDANHGNNQSIAAPFF
jgi:hypothetical protein